MSSSKKKTSSHRTSRREERLKARAKAQQRKRYLYGGVGLIGLVILIFVIFNATQSSVPALDPNELADPTVGPDSAPVQILEFSDFGCPSCRAWHNAGIQEAIVEQFGDQVQFVWKDFPVISAESPQAAEAAQCANVQGMFWPYHDYIYEHLSGLDRKSLSRYAEIVGLDVAAFDQCLDSHQTRPKVAENLKLARSYNLRGAPSFVVNGKVLPAPPNFDQLAAIVENELNQ